MLHREGMMLSNIFQLTIYLGMSETLFILYIGVLNA